MPLDFEKYMPYLDKFDMPREHKEQIIRTVWNFMGEQVDVAFGQHPVQLACEYNKKTLSSNDNAGLDSKNGISK